MMGSTEKIQLLFKADIVDRRIRQQLQGVDDFVHIIDDQLLGAEHGAIIQGRVTHAPHVAVDTLVESEQ